MNWPDHRPTITASGSAPSTAFRAFQSVEHTSHTCNGGGSLGGSRWPLEEEEGALEPLPSEMTLLCLLDEMVHPHRHDDRLTFGPVLTVGRVGPTTPLPTGCPGHVGQVTTLERPGKSLDVAIRAERAPLMRNTARGPASSTPAGT